MSGWSFYDREDADLWLGLSKHRLPWLRIRTPRWAYGILLRFLVNKLWREAGLK